MDGNRLYLQSSGSCGALADSVDTDLDLGGLAGFGLDLTYFWASWWLGQLNAMMAYLTAFQMDGMGNCDDDAFTKY